MGKQREALKMAIKDELIGEFRRAGDLRPGTVIPRGWLYDDFLPSLSGKEEEALEKVVAEMIGEGLMEYVPGPQPTYRLTAGGAAKIC